MMKHAIFATCSALAMAGAVTLSAQTPSLPRPGAPQPAPSTPARTDDRTITVSGCLKAWDPAPEPKPGEPNRPNTTVTKVVDKFLLANVESEGAGTPGAATTPGIRQYLVVPATGVSLTPHLNHKVRITGKVEVKPPVEPQPAPAPGDPKPADPTPNAPAHPKDEEVISTLTASDVTMVAETCPATSR